jgi:hypothetical protein
LGREFELLRVQERQHARAMGSHPLLSLPFARVHKEDFFFNVPNTYVSKRIWPTEFGTCLLLRRVAQSLCWQRKLLNTWMTFR